MDHCTTELFSAATPVVPIRGVHLDLKGLPPTAERLLSLLQLFAAARYTAVVVEWEDTFPWTVDERFRSPTAYTQEQIIRFRETAAALEIELIPLVQCLGHMETPLSVAGYEHLRELPDDESGLNPLAPGARELIQSMVDDVLTLMPDVSYFHLGGDEARTFGQNPETQAYVEANGKGALYLHHIEPILDTLNSRTSARNPVLGMKPLGQLEGIVKEADRLAEEIRHCFAGLLQPASIEEYLVTRLDPFRQEWTELRSMAAALPSRTHAICEKSCQSPASVKAITHDSEAYKSRGGA